MDALDRLDSRDGCQGARDSLPLTSLKLVRLYFLPADLIAFLATFSSRVLPFFMTTQAFDLEQSTFTSFTPSTFLRAELTFFLQLAAHVMPETPSSYFFRPG